MGNPDKNKRMIRRMLRLPLLCRLTPLVHEHWRRAAIPQEAAQLAGTQSRIILIGANDLAERFAGMLRSNPSFWGIIPLPGEELSPDFADLRRDFADLLAVRAQPLAVYCMSAYMERYAASRLYDLGLPVRMTRLGYGTKAVVRGCALMDAYDPLVGCTRVHDSTVPGYTVYTTLEDGPDGMPEGPQGRARRGTQYRTLRILTLGGSTSDATFGNLKSWPEYLFDTLRNMELPVTVFSGGIGGYCSVQELKKLLRDAPALQPDLVISYSGFNDSGGKYTDPDHPFYLREEPAYAASLVSSGIVSNSLQTGAPLTELSLGPAAVQPCFRQWLSNEHAMHGLCTEFGADFHAFLQPAQQKYMHNTRFYRDAQQNFGGGRMPDWMHDLTDLFDDQPGVFCSVCHVYEAGNRAVARAVLPCALHTAVRRGLL